MNSRNRNCDFVVGVRGSVSGMLSWIKSIRRLVTLAVVFAFAQGTLAQIAANQPFSIIGPIESFTLTTPGNILSGGTMKVNNITVTIPTNTIIVFPTGYWTVNQVFRGPTQSAAPATASGLALNDPIAVRRPGAFEAEIQGNTVNGQ